MAESKFQAGLIRELREMFPGCYILKNDANYVQGIPDLVIFYNNNYAFLEVKDNAKASRRPNQEYHVNQLNKMSFARFIYPENKEEVLNDLQHTFES